MTVRKLASVFGVLFGLWVSSIGIGYVLASFTFWMWPELLYPAAMMCMKYWC